MTQPNNYVLEGGASNEVSAGQNFFLTWDINLLRQFFYETEFKLISKRHFETSDAMRILNVILK
jgi:hypothetical protein